MIIGIEKAAVHLFDLEKWAGKFEGAARLLTMKPLKGSADDLARLAGSLSKSVSKAPATLLRPPSAFKPSTPPGVLKPSVTGGLSTKAQGHMDKLPGYLNAARKAGLGNHPVVTTLANAAAGKVSNTPRLEQILMNGIMGPDGILELIRRSMNSVRLGKYTDFFGG